MLINIENYRGVKSASLSIATIALVAAPNASGKSAIAQAIGAVLSGQAMPIPGIAKSMAGMVVRMGASAGFAQLETDGGTARVDWKSNATFKTKGSPPSISTIAAGLESLVPANGAPDDSAHQKRRAELLIEILNAHPTFEDVRARLAVEGISETVAAAIWDNIEKQGWDGAHAQAKETGARLKGQWEAVTGKRYGSRIAESYVPDEWEPELAGASESALQAAVTDARDALDGMIAVTAVDDAERDRLYEIASQLLAREDAERIATAAKLGALSAGTAVKNELQSLRDPKTFKAQECPHCSGLLSVAGGIIAPMTPITAEESAKWDDANERLTRARADYETAEAQSKVATAALTEARDAANKLSKLGSGNASIEQINAARESAQSAQLRLDAFSKKSKADRLQNSILQNAVIVTALDVAGIRQSVLHSRIQTFLRDSVSPICTLAQWGSLGIESDMSLSYGARAWSLLSESERYRVRVVIQLAVAKLQGAQAVIIDAADILDKTGRNGLIRVVRDAEIPAVICMTIATPSDVPDLSAAGIGESFWIHDGELMPLSMARK